jgi:hypothetical protein
METAVLEGRSKLMAQDFWNDCGKVRLHKLVCKVVYYFCVDAVHKPPLAIKRRSQWVFYTGCLKKLQAAERTPVFTVCI